MAVSEKLKEKLLKDVEAAMGKVSTKKSDKLNVIPGVPTLLLGEAGIGKTWEITKYAENIGAKLVFKALDISTESIDLLGYQIKDGDNFLFMDGPVTESFRLASKGEKVVLFLDELLRAPQRELSMLIGAFLPHHDGKLRLKTSKVVDGKMEELAINADRISIICASNIGGAYSGIANLDPALRDRFNVIFINKSRKEILDILNSKGTGDEGEQVLKIMEKLEDMHENKLLFDRKPTLRHAVRALEWKDTYGNLASSALEAFKAIVTIEEDGNYNEAQLDALETLVYKHANTGDMFED